MFILTCDITIGQHRFNQVHDVKIEKSWRNLDDKATLKLPRSNKLLEKDIKVGDPVSITLSYDEVPSKVEFEGYVKKIKPKIPLEIECEDATWLLRQTHIEENIPGPVSLKSVVERVISIVNEQKNGQRIQLDPDIDDIVMKKMRFDGVSAAEAINKLKDTYGLAAYFIGHHIYVGMAYRKLTDRVNYGMARNVVKNNLTFRKAEDVKIKVKATSIGADNTLTSTELGDAQGDQRSLFFYDVESKDDLKKLAGNELAKLKFDGYEGHITTFLIPYAQPGMTAVINDPDHPDQKNGSYVIDSVTTTFGMQGARRKIELGALIAKESTTTTTT